MAQLACQVLDEAAEALGKAEALVIQMEPLLEKRYADSSIYAYTNRRAVPPGDVLLAAAKVSGLSLDERLGLGRQPNELERQVTTLRDQVDGLRQQMAALEAKLMDSESWGAVESSDSADAVPTEHRRSADSA